MCPPACTGLIRFYFWGALDSTLGKRGVTSQPRSFDVSEMPGDRLLAKVEPDCFVSREGRWTARPGCE